MKKDNSNQPVQVVLTYTANGSEKSNLHTKVVGTVKEATGKLIKLDDNDKRMRRYSFDDNGGGYLGL
jgi:hypothetical protein